MSKNPLLSTIQFPDFNTIAPEHAYDAIIECCTTAKTAIENLISIATPTWATYEQLEVINDQLNKTWSPIAHLHSVMNTDAWRAAYAQCQPVMSQYGAEMSQHSGIYHFYCQLRDGAEWPTYTTTQQKIIADAIRDFELSGVNLSDEKKTEYQALVQSASELYTTFSNNLLDATQAFHLLLPDDSRLTGIPESARALYQQLAEQHGQSGYRITLDFPSYFPALTHAEDRALREELYYAYATRASEIGPNAGEYDNTPIIDAIMAVRDDIAALLGFEHYSDLSLANKMADSPAEVIAFLDDLVSKSRPQALREFSELQQYAQTQLHLAELEPWDVAYAAEKLKQAEYAISDELLRPYFPVPKVMDGLFDIVGKLFNVTVTENTTMSTWHPDVTTYSVMSDGKEIAYFYLDLYARQGKNGGAWMNGAVDKIVNSSVQQLPVTYLVCNFIPPTAGEPAYLSHNEITTLFHEFGHGLHHMLTRVNHSAASGINGVEWDAVELPSQFMENFCFEYDVLTNMSEHKQTQEPLPRALFEKLIAAKNFQSAMQMVRQLEFSLFDMKIHNDSTSEVMRTLASVRQYVAVTEAPEYQRFPMSFAHIFAGGYAAGYYSYKWAEVLSADAFARFEEEGVYNATVGRAFKDEILARGSSRTAMENFIAFRGRKPTIDALLQHSGITH